MSKNSYSRVGGENVRLLQALIDEAPSYTKPTNSRNANILKSIINNTEYNEPPQSEIEELLIALKAKIGGEIEVNELTVTENGTYDAGLNKAFNPVKVNVQPDLITKSITQNGTYQASSDNADGYSIVDVNVEGYKISEVSGLPSPIATFTDGAPLPMPKLKIAVEPIQEGSGDPSPTNIRPISGWDEVNVTRTGKNLFDYTNISEITVGTSNNKNGAFFKKEGTYSVSAVNSGNYMCVRVFNADGSTKTTYNVIVTTTITPVTFTISNGEYFAVYDANNNPLNMSKSLFENWQVQVELSSQPTAYEPYNGQTYTIDLDGTRYGGKVDLVSGVMTVDRVIVTFDDSEWTEGTILSKTAFQRSRPSAIPSATNFISNFIKRVENLSGSDENVGYFGSSYFNIYVPSKTLAEWKTLLSSTNMEVVYPLATPITIQLTPTVVKSLRGVNNISADSGDVLDGKYFAEL